jgi:hypothetical protein
MERARILTAPEPGWFTMRLVRGGPQVPARIYQPCPIEFCWLSPWQWVDRRYKLEAEIDGTPTTVDSVWLYGRRSTMAEFEYLTHKARWARVHQPEHPAANPRAKIDLGKMKSVY